MTEHIEDFSLWDDERIAAARVAAEDLIPDAEPSTPDYDYPQPDFVKQPRRKNSANEYERKLKGGINTAIRFLVEHESTVPDAAILLLAGPNLAESWGNAAAADKRIARAIDFLTEPTENPVTLAIMTTVPVVFQILRNHEPQLEPSVRGIRIPFRKNKDGTKKYAHVKFGLKLKRLRPMTNDPEVLARHVFTDPRIRESLEKQNIRVAGFVRAD